MSDADIGSVEFEPESFDAVVSFFALIHLPLDDQLPLLCRIAGWLRPGGLFVATTGYWAWTGSEENWLDGGAPMWWRADVVEPCRCGHVPVLDNPGWARYTARGIRAGRRRRPCAVLGVSAEAK